MTWEEVEDNIDHWPVRHQEFEDDDMDPPSDAAYRVAKKELVAMISLGMPPPKWMMPTGEGGICFEWRDGDKYTRHKIEKDGKVFHHEVSV